MTLGSAILDVAIGITFVFILLSVVCSAVREGIEAWLKTRGTFLNHGIRGLLRDSTGESLAKELYEHPLVRSLYAGNYNSPTWLTKYVSGTNLPSYIPSQNFARALLDIAARGPASADGAARGTQQSLSLSDVRANASQHISDPVVQRAILVALDSANGELDLALANVAAWYDSAMDRVSGWYKRATQWFLFFIGLFIAIVLNINTVAIADYLYRNEGVRSALVARSQNLTVDSANIPATYEQARNELDTLELPIGWTGERRGPGLGIPREKAATAGLADYYRGWILPLVGWILTALAASMGAPFWFDVLNKFTVIRATVKPHEKSPEEASEDRQISKTRTGTPSTQPAETVASGGAAAITPGVADADEDVDGCDVVLVGAASTPDEELPEAKGGVA